MVLCIALISDVHLEYNTLMDLHIPEADILVCAGDIGSPFTRNYVFFLEKMVQKYKYVILVPGNHEYYQHSQALNRTYPRTISEVEQRLEKLCAELGVIYLQKRSVKIEGILFMGCTLWGDPTSSGGEEWWNERYDAKHIADFKNMDNYLMLHQEHKDWLEKELSKTNKNKTVVVTHHLPSYGLIETKFKGSSKNGYYTSHSDELVEKADLWLAGHTHCFIDKKIKGTRCICNPVGYPWEDCPYKQDLIICAETKNV